MERTTLGFNTVLEDVEAFDQSQLRAVDTEVKNTLPSRESENDGRPFLPQLYDTYLVILPLSPSHSTGA